MSKGLSEIGCFLGNGGVLPRKRHPHGLNSSPIDFSESGRGLHATTIIVTLVALRA